MPLDPTSPSIAVPVPVSARATQPDRAADRAAERETLGELAAQFESMLMLEMIKQMRKSLLDDAGEGEGLGNETYSSTIDSELALHLARAGGLGLTPAMVEAWERQQAAVPASTAAAPNADARLSAHRVPAATAVHPALAEAPATLSVARPEVVGDATDRADMDVDLSLEMSGRVSSSYGWRSDPFRRRAKFHGGIDLAAAYGTHVPAAAGGTVVAAEERGGYGLTVVIRHPNGYESRYAHLSSLDVKAGDTVAAGQQVGRVGSTGRSTGPHLHFEVTQAGRRVDPERFVRNLTSDIKGQ